MKKIYETRSAMPMHRCSLCGFSGRIGSKDRVNVKVIAEEPYYRYIPKNGLKLSTKVSMTVSDQFKMVKMIHLKL